MVTGEEEEEEEEMNDISEDNLLITVQITVDKGTIESWCERCDNTTKRTHFPGALPCVHTLTGLVKMPGRSTISYSYQDLSFLMEKPDIGK